MKDLFLVIFLFFWSNPIIRFNKIFLEREELDRKFLENLKFSKIFRFANKTTVLQMEKAWTLVWNSNKIFLEREELDRKFLENLKFSKIFRFANKTTVLQMKSLDIFGIVIWINKNSI